MVSLNLIFVLITFFIDVHSLGDLLAINCCRCGSSFLDERYICCVCSKFTLCPKCHKSHTHDPSHPFLCINRVGQAYTPNKTILTLSRRLLMAVDITEEDCIKTVVKGKPFIHKWKVKNFSSERWYN